MTTVAVWVHFHKYLEKSSKTSEELVMQIPTEMEVSTVATVVQKSQGVTAPRPEQARFHMRTASLGCPAEDLG